MKDLYKYILSNHEYIISDYINKNKNKIEHYYEIDNIIPNNTTHLTFGYCFNQQINNSIPNSVTHLSFRSENKYILQIGDIPDSVTHLRIGFCFNQISKKDIIPNSVTHFFFDNYHSNNLQICDNFSGENYVSFIPNSVTYLTIRYNFDEPLQVGIIPNSVKHLVFGDMFNQYLIPNFIPNSVTHLFFGDIFNKIIDEGVIPNSVTHITFGSIYNKPIGKNVIPNSVTHITFKNVFASSRLFENLPKNLTELIIFDNNYDYISELLNNFNIFLLGILDKNNYIQYINNDNNIKIHNDKKILLDNYIRKNMTFDKLIGKVIIKELFEKVFHPKRLLKICNEFNIELYDLLKLYKI
jgi:hypothetical protein